MKSVSYALKTVAFFLLISYSTETLIANQSGVSSETVLRAFSEPFHARDLRAVNSLGPEGVRQLLMTRSELRNVVPSDWIPIVNVRNPSETVYLRKHSNGDSHSEFYDLVNHRRKMLGQILLEIRTGHLSLFSMQLEQRKKGYGETVARWVMQEAVRRFPENPMPLVLDKIDNLAILHFAELLFEEGSIEFFNPSQNSWRPWHDVQFNWSFVMLDRRRPEKAYEGLLIIEKNANSNEFKILQNPKKVRVSTQGLRVEVIDEETGNGIDAVVSHLSFALRGRPRPELIRSELRAYKNEQRKILKPIRTIDKILLREMGFELVNPDAEIPRRIRRSKTFRNIKLTPSVILVPHGMTPANEEHRFNGQLETEKNRHLSEDGKTQADEGAKALWQLLEPKIKSGSKIHFLASPAMRVQETAAFFKKIASEHGFNIELTIDKDLLEVKFGSWEGKTVDEIKKHSKREGRKADHYRQLDALMRAKGGESFLELSERVLKFAGRLNRDYSSDDIVVIFGHRTFLSTLKLLTQEKSKSASEEYINWRSVIPDKNRAAPVLLDSGSLTAVEMYPLFRWLPGDQDIFRGIDFDNIAFDPGIEEETLSELETKIATTFAESSDDLIKLLQRLSRWIELKDQTTFRDRRTHFSKTIQSSAFSDQIEKIVLEFITEQIIFPDALTKLIGLITEAYGDGESSRDLSKILERPFGQLLLQSKSDFERKFLRKDDSRDPEISQPQPKQIFRDFIQLRWTRIPWLWLFYQLIANDSGRFLFSTGFWLLIGAFVGGITLAAVIGFLVHHVLKPFYDGLLFNLRSAALGDKRVLRYNPYSFGLSKLPKDASWSHVRRAYAETISMSRDELTHPGMKFYILERILKELPQYEDFYRLVQILRRRAIADLTQTPDSGKLWSLITEALKNNNFNLLDQKALFLFSIFGMSLRKPDERLIKFREQIKKRQFRNVVRDWKNYVGALSLVGLRGAAQGMIIASSKSVNPILRKFELRGIERLIFNIQNYVLGFLRLKPLRRSEDYLSSREKTQAPLIRNADAEKRKAELLAYLRGLGVAGVEPVLEHIEQNVKLNYSRFRVRGWWGLVRSAKERAASEKKQVGVRPPEHLPHGDFEFDLESRTILLSSETPVFANALILFKLGSASFRHQVIQGEHKNIHITDPGLMKLQQKLVIAVGKDLLKKTKESTADNRKDRALDLLHFVQSAAQILWNKIYSFDSKPGVLTVRGYGLIGNSFQKARESFIVSFYMILARRFIATTNQPVFHSSEEVKVTKLAYLFGLIKPFWPLISGIFSSSFYIGIFTAIFGGFVLNLDLSFVMDYLIMIKDALAEIDFIHIGDLIRALWGAIEGIYFTLQDWFNQFLQLFHLDLTWLRNAARSVWDWLAPARDFIENYLLPFFYQFVIPGLLYLWGMVFGYVLYKLNFRAIVVWAADRAFDLFIYIVAAIVYVMAYPIAMIFFDEEVVSQLHSRINDALMKNPITKFVRVIVRINANGVYIAAGVLSTLLYLVILAAVAYPPIDLQMVTRMFQSAGIPITPIMFVYMGAAVIGLPYSFLYGAANFVASKVGRVSKKSSVRFLKTAAIILALGTIVLPVTINRIYRGNYFDSAWIRDNKQTMIFRLRDMVRFISVHEDDLAESLAEDSNREQPEFKIPDMSQLPPEIQNQINQNKGKVDEQIAKQLKERGIDLEELKDPSARRKWIAKKMIHWMARLWRDQYKGLEATIHPDIGIPVFDWAQFSEHKAGIFDALRNHSKAIYGNSIFIYELIEYVNAHPDQNSILTDSEWQEVIDHLFEILEGKVKYKTYADRYFAQKKALNTFVLFIWGSEKSAEELQRSFSASFPALENAYHYQDGYLDYFKRKAGGIERKSSSDDNRGLVPSNVFKYGEGRLRQMIYCMERMRNLEIDDKDLKWVTTTLNALVKTDHTIENLRTLQEDALSELKAHFKSRDEILKLVAGIASSYDTSYFARFVRMGGGIGKIADDQRSSRDIVTDLQSILAQPLTGHQAQALLSVLKEYLTQSELEDFLISLLDQKDLSFKHCRKLLPAVRMIHQATSEKAKNKLFTLFNGWVEEFDRLTIDGTSKDRAALLASLILQTDLSSGPELLVSKETISKTIHELREIANNNDYEKYTESELLIITSLLSQAEQKLERKSRSELRATKSASRSFQTDRLSEFFRFLENNLDDDEEEMAKYAEEFGIDSRPIRKGLLHPLYVAHDMQVKAIVNPNNQPKKALYKGAGADVSNFLLSTNATEADFVSEYFEWTIEDLRWITQIDPESADFKKETEVYRNDKYLSGYGVMSKQTSGFDRQHLLYTKRGVVSALALELDAIGVDLKHVRVSIDDRGYLRIDFPWAYPGDSEKDRTIHFLDVSNYRRALKHKMPYDFYYRRAGFHLPAEDYARDVWQKALIYRIYRWINPGGFLITDDFAKLPIGYQDMGSNFPIALPKIEIPDWTHFERLIFKLRKVAWHGSLFNEAGLHYGWDVTIRQKPITRAEMRNSERTVIDDVGAFVALIQDSFRNKMQADPLTAVEIIRKGGDELKELLKNEFPEWTEETRRIIDAMKAGNPDSIQDLIESQARDHATMRGVKTAGKIRVEYKSLRQNFPALKALAEQFDQNVLRHFEAVGRRLQGPGYQVTDDDLSEIEILAKMTKDFVVAVGKWKVSVERSELRGNYKISVQASEAFMSMVRHVFGNKVIAAPYVVSANTKSDAHLNTQLRKEFPEWVKEPRRILTAIKNQEIGSIQDLLDPQIRRLASLRGAVSEGDFLRVNARALIRKLEMLRVATQQYDKEYFQAFEVMAKRFEMPDYTIQDLDITEVRRIADGTTAFLELIERTLTQLSAADSAPRKSRSELRKKKVDRVAVKLRRPFKLVFSDLADTLIDSKPQPGAPAVHPETVLLVQDLHSEKVSMAVATGRNVDDAMVNFINHLPAESFGRNLLYTENGNRGFRFDNLGQLDENTPLFLNPVASIELIPVLRKLLIDAWGEVAGTNQKLAMPLREYKKGNTTLMFKFILPNESQEFRDQLTREIEKRLRRQRPFKTLSVLSSPRSVTISQGDKSDALRHALLELGLREEDVLILGDSHIDDPMFRVLRGATKVFIGKEPYPAMPKDVIRLPLHGPEGTRSVFRLILNAVFSRDLSDAEVLMAQDADQVRSTYTYSGKPIFDRVFLSQLETILQNMLIQKLRVVPPRVEIDRVLKIPVFTLPLYYNLEIAQSPSLSALSLAFSGFWKKLSKKEIRDVAERLLDGIYTGDLNANLAMLDTELFSYVSKRALKKFFKRLKAYGRTQGKSWINEKTAGVLTNPNIFRLLTAREKRKVVDVLRGETGLNNKTGRPDGSVIVQTPVTVIEPGKNRRMNVFKREVGGSVLEAAAALVLNETLRNRLTKPERKIVQRIITSKMIHDHDFRYAFLLARTGIGADLAARRKLYQMLLEQKKSGKRLFSEQFSLMMALPQFWKKLSAEERKYILNSLLESTSGSRIAEWEGERLTKIQPSHIFFSGLLLSLPHIWTSLSQEERRAAVFALIDPEKKSFGVDSFDFVNDSGTASALAMVLASERKYRGFRYSDSRSELRNASLRQPLNGADGVPDEARSELRRLVSPIFSQTVQPSITREQLKYAVGIDQKTQMVGLLPNLSRLPDLVYAVTQNLAREIPVVIFAGTQFEASEIKAFLPRDLIESGKIAIVSENNVRKFFQNRKESNLLAFGLPEDARYADWLQKLLTYEIEVESKISSLEQIEEALGIAHWMKAARAEFRAKWLNAIAA